MCKTFLLCLLCVGNLLGAEDSNPLGPVMGVRKMTSREKEEFDRENDKFWEEKKQKMDQEDAKRREHRKATMIRLPSPVTRTWKLKGPTKDNTGRIVKEPSFYFPNKRLSYTASLLALDNEFATLSYRVKEKKQIESIRRSEFTKADQTYLQELYAKMKAKK